MKKTVISANCVVGMAVLCLPVFLLFVTDTFAAVCLRLIAGLKPHNLLGSQPALQCAVRFTIQVQNLTIKYQNTAYLEKIVDFILLFCYIETTSQAGTAARYFAANPPKRIHPHKLIRDMNHQYVNTRVAKENLQKLCPLRIKRRSRKHNEKIRNSRIKLSTARKNRTGTKLQGHRFCHRLSRKREAH